MSDGAFVTGWRVYRARRSEFLDPVRVRRRTVVSGIVATVAGAAVVVTQLLWDWTGVSEPAAVGAAVAFAAAIGCLVATFLRTSRKLQAQPFSPLPGGWRRDERIGAQFTARPPALDPEDRDAVLDRADRSVEPAIASIDRLRWIPTGWFAACIGVIAVEFASTDGLVPVLVPVVFGLLQGGTAAATITWLGRAELTRRRVAMTLAVEPTPPLPVRNTEPRGSKVVLPDQ
ncbi:hypothetical protein ACLBWP_06190 [Microbacterium sp. M1A1_1b]